MGPDRHGGMAVGHLSGAQGPGGQHRARPLPSTYQPWALSPASQAKEKSSTWAEEGNGQGKKPGAVAC